MCPLEKNYYFFFFKSEDELFRKTGVTRKIVSPLGNFRSKEQFSKHMHLLSLEVENMSKGEIYFIFLLAIDTTPSQRGLFISYLAKFYYISFAYFKYIKKDIIGCCHPRRRHHSNHHANVIKYVIISPFLSF